MSPVYKGESMLPQLIGRIQASVAEITEDYEIILVNDQSPDNSWSLICEYCRKDPRIKGVNLSRNFGQHYAISAGLSQTSGDWIVVMDCDLQDRPEEIPNLYRKAVTEGYDSVFAQRLERKDSGLKKLSSSLFYAVFSFLTDTKQDKSISNFGIYSRKVIDAIMSMGDSIRYFPVMAQWVGFRKGYLPIQHSERESGKSSYSLIKLFRLAGDNMIGFSEKPLKIMLRFGVCIIAVSIIVALVTFIKWATGAIVVSGYTTLVISIWMAVGLLTMMIGIAGLYIGKIYDRVKGRPFFIIKETQNISKV